MLFRSITVYLNTFSHGQRFRDCFQLNQEIFCQIMDAPKKHPMFVNLVLFVRSNSYVSDTRFVRAGVGAVSTLTIVKIFLLNGKNLQGGGCFEKTEDVLNVSGDKSISLDKTLLTTFAQRVYYLHKKTRVHLRRLIYRFSTVSSVRC